jgi:uncharacterized delta-60 repeat protein
MLIAAGDLITYNPNDSFEITFTAIDKSGTSHPEYDDLVTYGGTITLTQGGNTYIASGESGFFTYTSYSIPYYSAAYLDVIQPSANPFVSGSTIFLTASVNYPPTPTPTETPTETPTNTPSPTPTVTPPIILSYYFGGSFTTFTGATQNGLIKLNTDGSKDTSFNIGTGFSGGTIPVNSIALQSDGKVLVGGTFTTFSGASQNRFIRLNTDGSKDTSFNIGTGFGNSVNSTAIQSDGKILAGGSFSTFTGASQNRLIRLNSDGSKDTSFNIGTGFNNLINSIALQSDGKVLAAGVFTTFTGESQNRLIRLNSDGSKDTSFDIGTGFGGTVSSIVIQSDGKVLVGGGFTTFTGESQNRLIRLNSDGSKDTSFDIGTGFGGTVNSIALQSDGKVLVGGGFTTYQGITSLYSILLNSDGSISNNTISFNNEVRSVVIIPVTPT